MNIKRFEIPGLAQYSYVVSSGTEAIVIDPIRDFDRYLHYASDQGLTIRYVTETHIHADFASGAAPLAAAAGAELALSAYDEGERFVYEMAHRELRNGDALRVGQVRLEALHTPGHTPEHLSFVLFDEERSATEPLAIFSGDFLFVGSLGRPDLLGEEEKHRLANELYVSVHERITHLPDGIQVFPAHGAGSLCGAGMSAQPDSALGYERATQRLFHLDKEAFINEVLTTVPHMPTYYPRMKALNSEGAVDYRSLSAPKILTPKDLKARMEADTLTLLDLRRPEAFGGAHIPGSVNIGAGQNLSLWAGWLLDPDTPIVFIGTSDKHEDERLALMRVGLDHVQGTLKQGFPSWIEAGLPIARTTQLGPQDVHTHRDSAVILDVRSDQEWKSGHISGATHIMLGDLHKHLSRLPKNRPVTTVCGSGYRSSLAASLLQQAGFTDVSSMHGGMGAWNAQQLPLENS